MDKLDFSVNELSAIYNNFTNEGTTLVADPTTFKTNLWLGADTSWGKYEAIVDVVNKIPIARGSDGKLYPAKASTWEDIRDRVRDGSAKELWPAGTLLPLTIPIYTTATISNGVVEGSIPQISSIEVIEHKENSMVCGINYPIGVMCLYSTLITVSETYPNSASLWTQSLLYSTLTTDTITFDPAWTASSQVLQATCYTNYNTLMSADFTQVLIPNTNNEIFWLPTLDFYNQVMKNTDVLVKNLKGSYGSSTPEDEMMLKDSYVANSYNKWYMTNIYISESDYSKPRATWTTATKAVNKFRSIRLLFEIG